MDLLIVGASARAAAFSARRAGFQPTTIDLFADADLTQAFPSHQVEPARYPEGLAELAEQIPPMRWLYTGALENHPKLIERISGRHDLLGNSGYSVELVRDPIFLFNHLKHHGIDSPEARLGPAGLPTDGSWLVKPLASAGGRGIHSWKGGTFGSNHRVYFQKRIDGVSLSALFLGIRLLGITRQFVGKPGNRFAYRGTLAPWPVSPEVFERVEQMGEIVAMDFIPKGIFGIDFILKDEIPWPVEVNPRYTAAVEALEWATGRSFLTDHAQDCGLLPPPDPIPLRAEGFVAKAILYARRPFVWSEPCPPLLGFGRMPEVADVPRVGTDFDPGNPVLTVLASGDSVADCRKRLASRLQDWRARIARLEGLLG
jgi:predicted ATP-grasp superfamily ATP-dependent carboligase